MPRDICYTARCIIARQGSILVMQAKGEAFTHLPGGHFDPGEQAIDALIREIREELGPELARIEWLAKIEDDWPGTNIHESMDLYAAVTWPQYAPMRALEAHLTAFWVQWYMAETVDLRPRAVYPWLGRIATKVA